MSIFEEILFFGETRLTIVLLHPGPTTSRDSAILVVHPNGTAIQEFTSESFGTEVVYCMSHVACRMSHVACRMSHVACFDTALGWP